MANLKIGKVGKRWFRLPLETVTSTIAILAIRGSGKTYAAGVLAEEMLKAGLHIVILDPEDAWWGLRSSAKGNKAGYPIVVFGGEKADVPITPESAKLVVNLIVEQGISAVVCTSDFDEEEQRTFVAAFAGHLYHKKRLTKYRTPLHLFIDEADTFVPQTVSKPDAKMVKAIDRCVRRGRRRGIGVTMISQRAAVINKNVLTQIETLIVLRITSSNDRKAIGAWVDAKGTADQKGQFSKTIASLKTGEAWIWSPGFLGVFERVQIREKETFDSSATPKINQVIRAPKKLADIDLKSVREAMEAVIEKQKAEDPGELRRRIAELQRQVARPTAGKIIAVPDKAAIERAVRQAVAQAIQRQDQKWRSALSGLKDNIWSALQKVMANGVAKDREPVRAVAETVTREKKDPPQRPNPPMPGLDGVKMAKMERAILMILAQRFPRSGEKKQVAVMAGYAHGSGSFGNSRSSLTTKGYIECSGQEWTATAEGIDALGEFEPLPKGPELVDFWGTRIGKCGRAILDALVEVYPNGMTRNEIAEITGYQAQSGSFGNYISKLRTLELINGKQEIKAADCLFDGGT